MTRRQAKIAFILAEAGCLGTIVAMAIAAPLAPSWLLPGFFVAGLVVAGLTAAFHALAWIDLNDVHLVQPEKPRGDA